MREGWVDFRVFNDGKLIIHDCFSYTPYDSFRELIDAAHLLRTSKATIDRKVIFNTEPVEYEFVFSKAEDIVTLSVSVYKDDRRTESHEEAFSLKGSYDEICMPFWRGLRRLQSEFEPEELDEAWHRPFPSEDLDKLTNILKGKIL